MHSYGECVMCNILLIVTDDSRAQQVKEMLSSWAPDLVVTRASTVQEALEQCANGSPDLILLDVSNMEADSLELVCEVTQALDSAPTVVLGDSIDPEIANEAVRCGAQDYLAKSKINSAAIGRVIRYSIERFRLQLQRRSLEKELAQSRNLEAIGQLAAGIAHEINTPTQYVSDNVRFLRDALTDVVEALSRLKLLASNEHPVERAAMQAILEAADVDYLIEEIPKSAQQSLDGLAQIARIVRAMKEFSHPPCEEKKPTDLNKALATTILVASNEWKYVATVEKDFAPDLPSVACLPGHINQVFLNLIVNAAHAIADVVDQGKGEKGKITVMTRSLPEGQVEISISDTGRGIEDEHAGKIFEPFFTTKRVGKGTGQGLSIAYDVVVHKHEGTIGFESRLGVGTRFTIRLPVGTPGFRQSA